MLTREYIKNLTDYQKQVFVTKGEFNDGIKELKNSFSTLTSAVDFFANRADTYYQEMTSCPPF